MSRREDAYRELMLRAQRRRDTVRLLLNKSFRSVRVTVELAGRGVIELKGHETHGYVLNANVYDGAALAPTFTIELGLDEQDSSILKRVARELTLKGIGR